MPLRTKKTPRINTRNASGNPNGFLLPIYNIVDDFVPPERRPEQVYVTVAAPGEVKGPHLHMVRWGLFTCIRGNLKVVIRTADGVYEEYFSGDDHGYTTIEVPAGTPAALVNIGDVDAYILNLPCPSWRPDAQDDHDVTFDDYDFGV